MNEYVTKNIIHTFCLLLSICKENCLVKAWKHSAMHLQMGPNVLLHYFSTQHVSSLKCTTNIILQLVTAALVVTVNKTCQISGQKLLSKQILAGSHARQNLILSCSLWALTSRLHISFFPCATTKVIFLLHLHTCNIHPESFHLVNLSSFSWNLKMQYFPYCKDYPLTHPCYLYHPSPWLPLHLPSLLQHIKLQDASFTIFFWSWLLSLVMIECCYVSKEAYAWFFSRLLLALERRSRYSPPGCL